MNNFLESKKVIWVFVIFGLVAVVAAIMAVSSGPSAVKTSQTNTPANAQKKQDVQIKKVDNSKLPDQFPADIPLETGATVTGNYNATAADGRSQATRSFETTKTLDDNFKLYSDFFKKSGYTVNSTINQANFKAILASKGDLKVQVNMSTNPTTKVKTIDITVTGLKK